MNYGGVAYLNARPLLEGLHPLVLDTPARLAERHARGEVDVALLPVAAGAAAGLPRVGNLGIAADGAVDSVLLFTDGALDRVYLDPASRTSRALALLWLKEARGLDPAIVEDPAEADAELVIGDAALIRAASGEPCIDLAAEWKRLTGLPFVFAAWYGDEAAADRLEGAYARGRTKIESYAAVASAQLGLTAADLERYLSERIRFRIGADEEAGLKRFLESASGLGLL